MVKTIFSWTLFLVMILNPKLGGAQTESEKESTIVNLIISFQQNRFTNSKKAKEDIEKAISIAETTKKKNNLVSTKILLGEFYDDNNNPNKALSQYTEAKKIATSIQDVSGLATCEYNLGFLYFKKKGINNQKKALTHFNEAISYAKKDKNKLLLAKSFNAASYTYYELNELELANQNSFNALILYRELKHRNGIAQSYLTLARIGKKKEEYKIALEYVDSTILIYKNLKKKNDINGALLVQSEIYFQKKDYNKAIEAAKKVENSPNVLPDQKIYSLNLLYQIYKAMNKTSASLDYLEESKITQDSLFQLERDRMQESVYGEQEAKNKLETLEKEAEINDLLLKQNKYITWSLIGVSVLFLLIALISFLFYRQNKLKSEREKIKLEQESIQLEQKLLRTQMNPHFIANSLAAIQGNIYKQDKEKSVTYLSKFAKLMRFILESSREKEVLLEKEIISLTNYLDLQKLLLEEKLTYHISISEELEIDEYKIPPMLIQPFVENAIVHGIELKSTPGIVTVTFEKTNNNLKVTIEDDGLGREKVNEIYKKRQSSHLSFSTNITNERITKMNNESNQNIFSKTKDVIVNGKVSGTKVELTLPLKNVF